MLDKNNLLILSYLYRPLSFPLTWLAVNLKIKANHVTFFSIILALIIPFLLISESIKINYLAAFFMFLYLVLDCVDGSIARVTRSENNIGSFLDTFSGLLFWGMVFPGIGIGASEDTIYFNNLLPFLPHFGYSIVILFFVSRLLSKHAQLNTKDPGELKDRNSSTFFLFVKSFYVGIPLLYSFAVYISGIDLLIILFFTYFSLALFHILYNSYHYLKTNS
jgi:phosphatidylglycerophosphate synthase